MPMSVCPACRHKQTVLRELLGCGVVCGRCGREYPAADALAPRASAPAPRSRPVVVAVAADELEDAPAPAPFPVAAAVAAVSLSLLVLAVGGGVLFWMVNRPKPDAVAAAPAPAVARPQPQPEPVRPVISTPTLPPATTPVAPPTPPPVAVKPEPVAPPVPMVVAPVPKPPATRPSAPPPAGSLVPDLEKAEIKVKFRKSEPRPMAESAQAPGYYQRKIGGFTVLISKHAYDESDRLDGQPVGFLEQEFARIAVIFPPETLTVLTRLPVWIEWDHTIPGHPHVLGVYFGGKGEALLLNGIEPRKAKTITLMSLKTCYLLRATGERNKITLLHEIAHAVHDQIYGMTNPVVVNAYEQAMTRRLYQEPLPGGKQVRVRYAATSEFEYFAEITCAYLDVLDYEPRNREELKKYDSVGYELMTKAWGTPEQIAARRKKDPFLVK